ncbi:OmpA family protein [Mucilaginibacter sp.]|uniref:OmpA family protein n=1 Tax=Mucilaginibacter sp. TaxID=1882438 RepID=UPI0025D2AE09|nr:OmpA family protein [Mucilaginibacter sp.]
MKQLLTVLFMSCLAAGASAQDSLGRKPSTFVFHMFYNDFKTAQQLRTSSFKNLKWSSIGDMQTGFGVNYLKGITRKIDFAATLDGSYTDYLYKNGTTNGSSEFLLDANAGLNVKLLTDRHPVVPYVFAGAGFSIYKGKSGLYAPVGIGLQFNFFNEAFVLANMQYRTALLPAVNNHFQYSIGIGASFGKKKSKPVLPPLQVVKIVTHDTPIIVKVLVKNIVITVTDEQTGLPLPSAEVSINGPDGKLTAKTDTNGRAVFNDIKAADYKVSGVLHGVATTTQSISKNNFNTADDVISINITHNDPRFTLQGVVINKNTGKPEINVTVNLVNITRSSSTDTYNELNSGAFSLQLEPNSNFTISGKKGGFISNIEKVSAKGLNRSTTLYVKLELSIEEALTDRTIVLSNIYYDKGNSKFRPAALPDLEKLVKFLKDNPTLRIEVDSHTDSRGNAAKNLKLSQARAQEVVNYLQKSGIEKTRLIPKGYGAAKLVNGCIVGVKCTEAQHEQNRRTGFKVIH